MEKAVTLAIQRWGKSLAVRIPASIARSVGFKVGQPVEVSAQDLAVRVAAAGEPRLTLKQKLALFDPERHGGEAMAAVCLGSCNQSPGGIIKSVKGGVTVSTGLNRSERGVPGSELP